jgi:hypothetical protein
MTFWGKYKMQLWQPKEHLLDEGQDNMLNKPINLMCSDVKIWIIIQNCCFNQKMKINLLKQLWQPRVNIF